MNNPAELHASLTNQLELQIRQLDSAILPENR